MLCCPLLEQSQEAGLKARVALTWGSGSYAATLTRAPFPPPSHGGNPRCVPEGVGWQTVRRPEEGPQKETPQPALWRRRPSR